MSRKLKTPELVAVIKWTEDEWEAVASRLLDAHGPALLSSPNLEEVKAKDVFIAQEVLPKGRHRKLISISQGFAGSRLRLHGILQKLKPVPRRAQTAVKQRRKEVLPDETVSEPGSDKKPATPRLVSGSGIGASPRSVSRASEKSIPDMVATEQPISDGNKTETASEASSQAVIPASAEIPGKRKHGHKEVPVVPDAEIPQDSLRVNAGPGGSNRPTGGDAHAPDVTSHRPMQRESGKSVNRAAAHDVASKHVASAAAAQPSANLVELARPFVAMVCQELAAAFVSALSRNASGQDLSTALQSRLFSGTTTTQPSGRNVRKEPEPRFKSEGPQEGTMSIEDDKGHAGESDVQPLFDPKLPPSPHSSFKPMIGLIGASTRDFGDLQQFYPQLQLAVVGAEAARSSPVLRDCQRMLGLREDISADTDEFLRREFGNRYLRVSGGTERIREQLNVWLDNPGSMSAPPGRQHKQFNGKGQSGAGPKKRHNRRPASGR